MPEILSKDEQHQIKRTYEQSGFAVLRNVFTEIDIQEASDLMAPLFEDFEQKLGPKIRDVGAIKGRSPGMEQPEIDRIADFEPRLKNCSVYTKVREIASLILNRKVYYVFDHAICKQGGGNTETAWHQDRGYMKGGTELDTVNFWVPFQDVTEENGALSYIPGSHKLPLVTHKQDPKLHPHVLTAEIDASEAYVLNMQKGDLCFHHPLTFHGASANKSTSQRMAWSLHFGAYGRYEYLKPSNLVRICRKMVAK